MTFKIVDEGLISNLDPRDQPICADTLNGTNWQAVGEHQILLNRRRILVGSISALTLTGGSGIATAPAYAGKIGDRAALASLVIELLKLIYDAAQKHYVVGENPKAEIKFANKTSVEQKKPVAIATKDFTGAVDWEATEEFNVPAGRFITIEGQAPPQSKPADKSFGSVTLLDQKWTPFKVKSIA
jgi:hypothetical protein